MSEADRSLPEGAEGGEEPEKRWVLVARTADRPGVLAAVSGVFSQRGVNFDSLAADVPSPRDNTVVALFRATQRRGALLVRTLRRLDAVDSVALRSADDPTVRAVGLMRVPDGVPFEPPPTGAAVVTGRGTADLPLVVQGSLRTVERAAGQVRDLGGTAVVVVLAV